MQSKKEKSAVTRIRTWVIAATTQCTNHYTITAATAAPTYGAWSNRQVISILAKIESITPLPSPIHIHTCRKL